MFNNTIIIDTRKELATKYKKAIESVGERVEVVNDLNSAFKYIQENEPDLIIISDRISEPLADFCHKIRVLTYNTRPIIVALSKSSEIEDRIAVLESGADDFIGEPVNIDEFKIRIKAHLRREYESNLDTKTLLPNEKYTKKVLKRVISTNNEWAVYLISIENFQSYKDVYTELAGDRVVQALIAIIKSSISETDFLSRVGENEFILITHPSSAEQLASFMGFAFDTVVPKFYSNDDATRGYMLLQGDEIAGIRIPFMALSVGVVSSEFEKFYTEEKLMTRLYQVKSLAKLPSKSHYVIDRPKISGDIADVVDKYNNCVAIIEKDDALALLLRTTLELQGYDVIDEVAQQGDVIPAVILIDAGDEMEGLSLCSELKNDVRFVNTKIIVTSVYHDKTLVLNSRADLYIPKPYEMATIVKWVEYFISQNRI